MREYAVEESGDGFAQSREMFGSLVATLAGSEVMELAHGELEEQLQVRGRELLRCLLQDHLSLRAVATTIADQATHADLSATRRKNLDRCVDYLTNNADYLHDDHALDAGWPIATGIIEGACRHLIKDRMDITGARWGLPGAEAILKLRALTSNGDFTDSWNYHLKREHHRIHQTHYTTDTTPQAA